MSMLPIKKIKDPDGSGRCYPLSVLEASVITSIISVGTQIGGYNKGDIIPVCTTLDEIIKTILSPNQNSFVINNWEEATQDNVPSSDMVKTALSTKENSGTAQNLLDSFTNERFDPLSNTVDQHNTQISNLKTTVDGIYDPENQTGTLKDLIDRVDDIYSSDGTTGILAELSTTVNNNLLANMEGVVYTGTDAPSDQGEYSSSNPVVLKKAFEYYVDLKIRQSESRSGSAVELVGVVNDECSDYNDYSQCETIDDVWEVYQDKHSDKYPQTTPQNGYLLIWDEDEYLYCQADNEWHPYGNLDGVVKSGEIIDSDISSDANINQSKISGLVSALGGKQDVITATGGLKFDENDPNVLKHSNNPVTAKTTSGLFKLKYDGYGHITESTQVTAQDITALGIPDQDTTYTAGTGLSLSGTTINHSNSVTAQSTAGLFKIAHDGQGHITSSSSISGDDPVLSITNISGLSSMLQGIQSALFGISFMPTDKADLTTDDGMAAAIKTILMKLGMPEGNIDV